MTESALLSEENLYEMLAFLVSSAHLCTMEPKLYGTFRLIDAACRLIDLSIKGGRLADEQRLRDFKHFLDEHKLLLMTDEKAYLEFLEEATRRIARELKRRAASDA